MTRHYGDKIKMVHWSRNTALRGANARYVAITCRPYQHLSAEALAERLAKYDHDRATFPHRHRAIAESLAFLDELLNEG